MTSEPLVALDRVSRHYGTSEALIAALDDVSLEIAHGQRTAVMGPSGSGKSTLLAVIGLLESVSAGSVRFDGRAVEGLNEEQRTDVRRGSVAFVFQSFHLIPSLSAVENVMLPLMPYRRAAVLEPEAAEWLYRVGLGDRVSHRPAALSGGEQQRVAIARALVTRPRLILADEPTGNLDTGIGSAVIDLLLETQAQQGFALVVATHDQSVAKRIGTVIQMHDGMLVDGRTP